MANASPNTFADTLANAFANTFANTFDIAIIGGGMAGLSLAVYLADARFAHLRIVIIEPRAHYARDRTWCYWNISEPLAEVHPFMAAVTKRWPNWRVTLGDGDSRKEKEGEGKSKDERSRSGIPNLPATESATESAAESAAESATESATESAAESAAESATENEGVQYEMIPADAFYKLALDIISTSPHITLRLNTAVDSLQSQNDLVNYDQQGAVVITTSHGIVHAALAFDSRPPANLSNTAWIQAFQGIEVEADTPCFDPKTVTLMDFSIDSAAINHTRSPANQVRFMYVLPLSATRALVEQTTFTLAAHSSHPPAFDETVMQRYLAQKFGVQHFRVLHREQGAIPMDPALRPSLSPGRVIKIGTAGGMCRASSGYTFFETQRALKLIAEHLLQLPGELAIGDFFSASKTFKLPVWRGVWSYWMDEIFLRVLANNPGIAPKLFTTLFDTVPTQSLVRFLSGVATPIDIFRVIAACPKWPFIRAVMSANPKNKI